MEPIINRPSKWRDQTPPLATSASAPDSYPPAPLVHPTPEQLALERLIREQQKTNLWMALQPIIQRPFQTLMGVFILYIIIHVWIYG
jgi:hypothetical protein